MKYLVMLGAKHTAKMPSLFISQNHTAEPMSIAITTSISQVKRRPEQLTQLPKVTQLVSGLTKTPVHFIAQSSHLAPYPIFFFFFFFFACWTYLSLPFFIQSFPPLTPFLFQLFIHSDYFFVIFNLTTMFKPIC